MLHSQWFAWWSGTWKEHNLQIGDKVTWGRSTWIDLSDWQKA